MEVFSAIERRVRAARVPWRCSAGMPKTATALARM
jgi:hypothetical protein